jgi:hypothetical protein
MVSLGVNENAIWKWIVNRAWQFGLDLTECTFQLWAIVNMEMKLLIS